MLVRGPGRLKECGRGGVAQGFSVNICEGGWPDGWGKGVGGGGGGD